MNIKKLTLKSKGFPEVLRQIPHPPKQLYVAGAPLEELLQRPRVAIVGSRKISPYGQQVTERLAGQLAERGIVIISGLAFGVDCLAHRSALEAGGVAIGVLPCPIEKIVPVSNQRLGQAIVNQGGSLVSEYSAGTTLQKQYFIARNRLMSGLANVLLITEAAEKSGSLHTANFALQQGRDVLAVPGSIYSRGSAGTNNLIKSGAVPVTSCADVLHVLGLEDQQPSPGKIHGRNAHEQAILDLLARGFNDGDQLLAQSQLLVNEFNQALTMLEISGKIRPMGANQWCVI